MKWTGMGHFKCDGGERDEVDGDGTLQVWWGVSEMKWTGMGHFKSGGGERDEVDGDGTLQVWWG